MGPWRVYRGQSDRGDASNGWGPPIGTIDQCDRTTQPRPTVRRKNRPLRKFGRKSLPRLEMSHEDCSDEAVLVPIRQKLEAAGLNAGEACDVVRLDATFQNRELAARAGHKCSEHSLAEPTPTKIRPDHEINVSLLRFVKVDLDLADQCAAVIQRDPRSRVRARNGREPLICRIGDSAQ